MFNRHDGGFTLIQVMVASSILGIITLVFTQLTKNMSDSDNYYRGQAEELELKHLIGNIIKNKNNCRISLAGNGPIGTPENPVKFMKTNVDQDHEGLDVSLYLANQNGDRRTKKKFNGADNPGNNDKSKFGKVRILSMKLIFNNPTASSNTNYIESSGHSDEAVLRVKVKRKLTNNRIKESNINFYLTVGMSTDGSGESTIKSCSDDLNDTPILGLKCYTIRRFEKLRRPNPKGGFINSDGSRSFRKDGLTRNDIVTLHGGKDSGGNAIPNDGLRVTPGASSRHDWFGMHCKADNGYTLFGCAHAASDNGRGDTDVIMTDTGCFAGDNDGDDLKNYLDIRCCRYER